MIVLKFGSRNFFRHHRFQTDCNVHPHPCPMAAHRVMNTECWGQLQCFIFVGVKNAWSFTYILLTSVWRHNYTFTPNTFAHQILTDVFSRNVRLYSWPGDRLYWNSVFFSGCPSKVGIRTLYTLHNSVSIHIASKPFWIFQTLAVVSFHRTELVCK